MPTDNTSKKNLPNPDDTTVTDDFIRAVFHHHCIRCNLPADTIHEIEPRSKAPKTWMRFENRVILCYSCHLWAHHKGANNSADELKKLREKRLDLYYADLGLSN